MSPCAQLCAVNSIFVKALPLLECLLGLRSIVLGIPDKHFRLVFDASGLAHSLNHAGWVVEQVIRVDDTDLNALLVAICLTSLTSRLGTNYAFLAEEVKQLPKLNIASLVLAEVIPTSHLVERRQCAAVVAGNAVLRMTNKENEVVCCEEIFRKDRRIAGFTLGVVRVRFACVVFPSLYWREFIGVCSNTAAVVRHRGADSRWSGLARRWNPVLCHVLDEGALALRIVSIYSANVHSAARGN